MTQTIEATKPDALATSPATPIELLHIAVSQNADIDKLTKLMDLQERWEKNEARKAFVVAMSAFKSHAIQVVKDKTNQQYQSKYVSLGNLIGTVTPFLSQHGLSARWEFDQASGIKVTCVVTHQSGHSESVSITFPPDKSGAKNPIQEIKSAITYAETCTFSAICGLASADSVDDDGNSSSSLDSGHVREQCEFISNARSLAEVDNLFKTAYKEAAAASDKVAMASYIQAKDTRKKALK